jgi:hypothetical protein
MIETGQQTVGSSYLTGRRFLALVAAFSLDPGIPSRKGLMPDKKKFLHIFKDYGLNMNPLTGEQHVLRRTSSGGPHKIDDDMWYAMGFVKNMKTGSINTDILDLAAVSKLGPSVFWPRGGEEEILGLLPPPGGRGMHHGGAPRQYEALLARPGDPAHTARTHWANPADTGSCDLDGGAHPQAPLLLRAIRQSPVAHMPACSAVDTTQYAL